MLFPNPGAGPNERKPTEAVRRVRSKDEGECNREFRSSP